MIRAAGVLALLALTTTACGRRDAGLTVFAASSLTDVVDELAASFTDLIGVDVDVVVGGSAGLAAQIRQGAPADVFLSADARNAAIVVDSCDGSCSSGTYATNSLVLAVPADNPAQVTGLHDLGRPELQVVLCAPQVPCGALTVAATTAASVDVAPDSLEPNVRAVLQRLELGEADVGLVYRTDVAGHAVEVVDVEALDDLVAEYHFVDLTGRDSPTDSSRFVDLLLGPTGQRILTAHGFGVP